MMRCPTRRVRERSGRPLRPRSGFTLIEMGMVISLLGLLAYLIVDFHVGQLNLRNAERRADGVVRDIRTIVDASLVWAAANVDGRWPHDVDGQIDIEQLVEDGLLVRLPQNRYFGCPGDPAGCLDYTLTGWDRDRPRAGGAFGDYEDTYTDVPADEADNPEDLIVRFTMPGSHAYAIAGQLPQGTVTLVPPDAGAEPTEVAVYRVEARMLRGGNSRFVLLNNEGRRLVFGRPGGVGSTRGGDLRNVAAIRAGATDGSTRIELGSGVGVVGALSVSAGADVAGGANVAGGLSVGAGLDVAGGADVTGALSVGAGLVVAGGADVTGALSVGDLSVASCTVRLPPSCVPP